MQLWVRLECGSHDPRKLYDILSVVSVNFSVPRFKHKIYGRTVFFVIDLASTEEARISSYILLTTFLPLKKWISQPIIYGFIPGNSYFISSIRIIDLRNSQRFNSICSKTITGKEIHVFYSLQNRNASRRCANIIIRRLQNVCITSDVRNQC